MARTLTTFTATQKARADGAEPILILRLDWGGAIGTKYYADRDLTTPVTAEGRLVNAAAVELSLSEHGVQAVSDVRLELSDHDGALSALTAQTPLVLKNATLYQHFAGGETGDLVPLLTGHVDDPLEWREADAILAFAVTDILTGHDVTIGHLINQDDFPTVVDAGAALPLVFGQVEQLAGVQAAGGRRGTLLRDVGANTSIFYIEGGENFPQDTSIGIVIAAETITGTMHGRVFTVTARTPKYSRIFSGGTVRLAGDHLVYVVNDARSRAVTRVRALKNFKLRSGAEGTRDVAQLVEIPARHYTVNLNDTTTFPALGRPMTTITFATPLTELYNTEWAGDEIWVDLEGYTPDGSELPEHPTEVIRALLTDFGGLTAAQIDDDSFAAAQTAWPDGQFAFALREQRELRDLLADLAFQARLQVLVLAGVVYLLPLSDAPTTAQAEFGDDNVAEASLALTTTAVEEIWSECTVTYDPDLSGRRSQSARTFTLKDATAETAWGRRAQELNLWAYREARLAKAVAQDYLNHHARAWQKLTLRTFLDTLELLPLDWVSVGGLVGFGLGQPARVESSSRRPGAEGGEADVIEYDLYVPVYPGCATTCQTACQAGGCEGAVEHAAATNCETVCETSCQEACELVCVTACQAACELLCQTSCQTEAEVPDRDRAFRVTMPANIQRGSPVNVTLQSYVISTGLDDPDYVPDSEVALALTQDGNDTVIPEATSNTGWSGGAKTVAVTISGGSGQTESTFHSEDSDSGRIGEANITIADESLLGFLLSGPAQILRDEGFDLTIQSGYPATGDPDTSYTPSGDIAISVAWEVVDDNGQAGRLLPVSTDNTGWVNGAKTVTMLLYGGVGSGSIRIVVTDMSSGRVGWVDLPIASYGFKVSAPGVAMRGQEFALTIQSVLLPSGDLDTSYVPAGVVYLLEALDDDEITPTVTDNTGWVNGAKTVTVTIEGGEGPLMALISAADLASGRTGQDQLLLLDSGAAAGEFDNPHNLAYTGEHAEAARTDQYTNGDGLSVLWDRDQPPTNTKGVKVSLQNGSSYYEAGDKKLYGYFVDFYIDSAGMVKLITSERREIIDTPEVS